MRYETEDEVVLIDPFLPPDEDFDPHGKPVRVLLTQGAHYRGTADFVERFGASVWTPPRAVWRKIPNPRHDRGAARRASRRSSSTASRSRSSSSSASTPRSSAATCSVGTGGRLRIFVDEADPELLLPSLEALAELPIERVIIPHGDLILSEGAARIRAAIAEAQDGPDDRAGVSLSFYCARELEREEVCAQRGEASRSWGWRAWRSSWSPPVAADRTSSESSPTTDIVRHPDGRRRRFDGGLLRR